MTIEDTLGSILDTLQTILVALEQRPAAGTEVAKIEVENMAKGPPKITSRSYDGSVLTRELVDQHLEAHAYATAQAEKMQMAGWERTLEVIEQGREIAERSMSPEQAAQHEPSQSPAVPDYDSEPTFAAKYITAFDEPAAPRADLEPVAENPPTTHALEPTPFDDEPVSAFAETSPGVHLPRRR